MLETGQEALVNQPMLYSQNNEQRSQFQQPNFQFQPQEDLIKKEAQEKPGEPQFYDKPDFNEEEYLERSRISMYQAADKKKTSSAMKMHEISDLSQDCEIGADAAPATLLSDIVKVDLVDTLRPILSPRKTCFITLKVEKIMSWQKSELDFPLLRFRNPNNIDIAVQLFRNLLSYMTDRKSSKKPIMHAKKYLKLCMNAEDEVKNEAYLQVKKQISNNPKYDSVLRGWKFLAILASSFTPPNPTIYNVIMNFLFFEMQNNNDSAIVRHAKYIFVRMVKTKERPRRNIPSLEELSFVEYLKPIPVKINYFSGVENTVKIESYTTISELKEQMMRILDFNLAKSIYFSVYEICTKKNLTEERFLDDDECVCDVISLWLKDLKKDEAKIEKWDFKLYLKLLIFYPFEEEDIETTSLLFYQIKYDVVTGKFNLPKEKILALAALQMLNEFGTDINLAKNTLNKNITRYIPPNCLTQFSIEELKQSILEEYSKISMFQRNQAKTSYINLLKDLPTFQAQQFDAKYNLAKSGTNDDNIPDECVIGIRPEGIVILDRDRNQVVMYKYERLLNWGISRDQLILNLESDRTDVRKVCFFTSQTKAIQDLIEIYCNLIIGKTMKDIKELFKKRGRKFDQIKTKHRIASSYVNRSYAYAQIQGNNPPQMNQPNNNMSQQQGGNINFKPPAPQNPQVNQGMLYGNSMEVKQPQMEQPKQEPLIPKAPEIIIAPEGNMIYGSSLQKSPEQISNENLIDEGKSGNMSEPLVENNVQTKIITVVEEVKTQQIVPDTSNEPQAQEPEQNMNDLVDDQNSHTQNLLDNE